MKNTLKEIVKKAKEGEEKSKEFLIKKYLPFVIKESKAIYLKGYDIEDLISLGKISILKAINKYNVYKSNNFTSYVTQAIRRNFYNEIRKVSKNRYESSLNKPLEGGGEIIDMIPSSKDLEKDIILKENIKELGQAIDTLSKKEKEFIYLIYYKNISMKKYGEINNLKYSIVIKRKDRILKKLRKKFKGAYILSERG